MSKKCILKTYTSHREFLKMSAFIHFVKILFYCSSTQESRPPESSQEFENVQMEDMHTEQATTTISFAISEDQGSVIDRVNDDNFFKV